MRACSARPQKCPRPNCYEYSYGLDSPQILSKGSASFPAPPPQDPYLMMKRFREHNNAEEYVRVL